MNKWIIPCNIKFYDTIGAFKNLNRINWKQSTNIQIGDIVYIYIAQPHSRITHKCRVIEVNLVKIYIDDEDYVIDSSFCNNYRRYMTLELIGLIENADLDWLRKQGVMGNIQGPCKIDFEI